MSITFKSSGGTTTTEVPVAADGTYSTDFFPILPDLLHGTDYLIPTQGDNGNDRPTNLYIFNPDPVNSLTVTVTDTIGTDTVVVPANSTVDYFTGTGTAPNPPNARFPPSSGTGPGPTSSTVRLTAPRPFWGLTVHDHTTNIADWGYAWLATDFLTETYTAPYSPGTTSGRSLRQCGVFARILVWIASTPSTCCPRIMSAG